jgi:glutaredoxin-like protein NrdH
MALTIRLYTKPACQQCDATKRWFKSKGFDFDNPPAGVNMFIEDGTEEHNLAAFRAINELQMPSVWVEDGNYKDHWTGFRPDKIDSLAERYDQG